MNNPNPNATVMTLEFSLIDDLPGVTPSRQKRSRETTAALLRAGEVMLRKHSLDELSIEALCAEVGATVGAFYSRFESKEVYFNALLELAARDSEVNLFRIQDGALTDVGLDPATRFRYPHEFSGGQRQRISIARAAVLEPSFIVLDEPTSALDMLFQAQMVDLLRELQRKRDLTYMFISHDLRVVASLASHLIVMRHGKVVEEGAASELFKNPKTDYTRALFAAAFRHEAAGGDVVAD